MPKAILINNRGLERDYQIPSGRIITLILEDDFSQITFWENGMQLGNDRDFLFDDSESDNDSYLLARMYVPSELIRSGLGWSAVEFFKDYTDASIYCKPHDGNVLSDGSHLTEDAPAFVDRMIEEGLIEDPSQEDFDNNEE
jgi:hypothetical protein